MYYISWYKHWPLCLIWKSIYYKLWIYLRCLVCFYHGEQLKQAVISGDYKNHCMPPLFLYSSNAANLELIHNDQFIKSCNCVQINRLMLLYILLWLNFQGKYWVLYTYSVSLKTHLFLVQPNLKLNFSNKIHVHL